MTPMTRALSAALLHFVWQGLLFAFLLWIVLFLLRKRSANARYLASGSVLALLVLLPVITTWTVYSAPGPQRGMEASVAQAAALASRTTLPVAWWPLLQAWVLPVWSAGVLLFSLRMAWGCRQVSALRRHGGPAEEALLATVGRLAARLGVKRVVRILVTTSAQVPGVVGWMSPVLLLPPAALCGLTAPQLEAVLAHELAHVRRHDYLVNLLQMVAESLLFYHPAVWWISARVRHERELCCDDLAVRVCGDPIRYARALTTLERLRSMAPAPVLGSTGGPLAYRIQRLLGAAAPEYTPTKMSGILVFSLGLACLALSLNWARGQSQPAVQRTAPSHMRGERGVAVDLGGSAVLHRAPVDYPREALEKGIVGTVKVETTLDAAGNVSDARVVSGPVELRNAALQSILQWHFVPDAGGATRQVSIAFQLPAEQIPPDDTSSDLEKTVRFLQDQLRASEKQKSPYGRTDDIVNLNFKLEFAKRQLEASRVTIAGRTLKTIAVQGLPEPLPHDLLTTWPVHVGDVLSRDSVEATERAVRQFDPHLECSFVPLEDGQAELRIRAPYAEPARRPARGR